MRKLLCIVCVISLLLLGGCGREVGESIEPTRRFVLVEKHETVNIDKDCTTWIIVDTETNVLYLGIFTDVHKFGLTPLLNADGTPMLYSGDDNG